MKFCKRKMVILILCITAIVTLSFFISSLLAICGRMGFELYAVILFAGIMLFTICYFLLDKAEKKEQKKSASGGNPNADHEK